MRTDVRQEDGERLEPVPIQRWRCTIHGAVRWTPGFLRFWGHYLASVVDAVLDEFTEPSDPPAIEQLSSVAGPAAITLRRWVGHLVEADTEALNRRLHREFFPAMARDSRSWKTSWSALKTLIARAKPAYGIFASTLLQWFRLHPPAPA